MPRSERVILHVSINMGRLPGERKGVEQMLERSSSTILKRSLFIEGNIPKCPYFQLIPSPGLVQEVRYSRDFPQERNHLSEIQQVFSGVIFEEFPLHLENCRSKISGKNKKSSKYGSFLQLCL